MHKNELQLLEILILRLYPATSWGPYSLHQVNHDHHGVEDEKDHRGRPESLGLYQNAGNGWTNKIAEGKGRQPNS